MKGFIEVHSNLGGRPILVGVSHIVSIEGNTIYADNGITELEYFVCVESYEELKELIAEAVEDGDE